MILSFKKIVYVCECFCSLSYLCCDYHLVVMPSMFCASVEYSTVPEKDMEASSMMNYSIKDTQENFSWLSIWWQQFVDGVTVS